MDGWLDGCMNGWLHDGWDGMDQTDGWMNGWINEWMGGWIDGLTNEEISGRFIE